MGFYDLVFSQTFHWIKYFPVLSLILSSKNHRSFYPIEFCSYILSLNVFFSISQHDPQHDFILRLSCLTIVLYLDLSYAFSSYFHNSISFYRLVQRYPPDMGNPASLLIICHEVVNVTVLSRRRFLLSFFFILLSLPIILFRCFAQIISNSFHCGLTPNFRLCPSYSYNHHSSQSISSFYTENLCSFY